jgi:hypothetical protein
MAKDKVYTADQGQPPAEPDSGSVGKPIAKKDQPEQLGSGIIVKKAKGGKVSSTSGRGDGIAQRGKTNCKHV